MDTNLHRNVMYVGGFIGLILIAFTPALRALDYKALIRHPLFIATLAYLIYSVLTIAWSAPDTEARIFKYAKLVFIIPLFLCVWLHALHQYKNLTTIVISVFVLSAAILGIAAIFNHFIMNDFRTMRIEGFGRAENANMLGILTAIAALLAIFSKQLWPELQKPLMRAGIVCALLVTLFFTFSRGAELAFCLSFTAFMLAQKRFVPVLALGALAAGVLLILYMNDFTNTGFFERGSSGRLDVWEASLKMIAEKPFFGHGVATKHYFDFDYMGNDFTAPHAHSLYISTLLQGGIVGLLCLLGVYGFAMREIFRRRGRVEYWTLLSLILPGLIMGITDFGGVHVNLGVTWLVFWMPVTMIIVLTLRGQKNPPTT